MKMPIRKIISVFIDPKTQEVINKLECGHSVNYRVGDGMSSTFFKQRRCYQCATGEKA